MSAITGDAIIEVGHKGMFLVLKCGAIRGQDLEYFIAQLLCCYSCTWHLSLNGKTCYGKPAISASALAVVQRRHHRDLPFGLQYATTSFSHVDQPCYCAAQNLCLLKWGRLHLDSCLVEMTYNYLIPLLTLLFVNDKNVYNFHAMQG